MKSAPEYALSRDIELPFARAGAIVRDALQAEGFGLLAQMDVAKTLREKLGEDIGDYEILGACAPPLAHKAILHEPDIGLLLPCNVVVRGESGADHVVVEALDPVVQLGIAGNPELQPLAEEVRARMVRVLDRVSAAASAGV